MKVNYLTASRSAMSSIAEGVKLERRSQLVNSHARLRAILVPCMLPSTGFYSCSGLLLAVR
jgi:hypothetical protein